MGLTFTDDTPAGLYNEFVAVENEIEAIGRRVKQLGIEAINADANYEQAKNYTLIRLFNEEAGDPAKDLKPFKRTEAQREAIYRTEHAALRLTRNLAKNNLQAEQTLLKAMSDKLSAMQSRKGMLLQEYSKNTDGRFQVVDPATGAWKLEGQAPQPAAHTLDVSSGQQTPAMADQVRTTEYADHYREQLGIPTQEAFPGEPAAELKEIYGKKAEPWDDESPIAKTLNDLVTAKQLGMIRALAREARVDVDEECNGVFSCRSDELNKKAASEFIGHLQDMKNAGEGSGLTPLRRAS